MNPPPRQRLIQTTAELLQQQGYRNTGLNQIIAASGTPKGSLYHYFPGGKDELVIAALQSSAATVLQNLAGVTAGLSDPMAGWSAVIDHFITQLEQSDFRKGCPVATVTLEQAALNPPIQQACAEAFAAWQAALAGWLTMAGAGGRSELLAGQLLSLLEGALVLSRAQLSTAPLRALKPLAATLISSTGPDHDTLSAARPAARQ